MGIPPSAPAQTKKKLSTTFDSIECMSGNKSDLGSCDEHLVDGKSDGEESGPLMTLHPSTFLHQSHDYSADNLPVLWVIILLIQL